METRLLKKGFWSKILLLTSLLLSANIFSQATLVSDQPDYAPGTTATFTGNGFFAGEMVLLVVHHYDGTPNTGENHESWIVIADEAGSFVTTWHVCEDDCLGSTLIAKADGLASGLHAEVIFTDGNVRFSTTGLPNGTSVTVSYSHGTTTGSSTHTTPGNSSNISPAPANGTVFTYTFPAAITAGGETYTLSPSGSQTATILNGQNTFTGNYFCSSCVGGLLVTAPDCAQGGSFTINYSPASGSNITVTATTPSSFPAKKNTAYTINGIAATVNGNSYAGGGTITGTTPNTSGFSAIVSLAYNDTSAPVLNCPSDITQSNDNGLCSAVVNFSAPVGTDNCPGVTTVQTAGLPSGSVFPKGQTTNTFVATDAAGNTSSCSFVVNVIDSEAPVAPILSDVTGECSAEASVPSAQDNCGGTIQGSTEDDLSYSTQGTHVIHWAFDDGNGNISYANQNVIIDDITAPVAPVLSDVTGECSAEASVPSAQDNCGGTIQGSTEDDLSYSTQGTHVIHWSFDDGNGNISYANQNVIIDDITAPIAPTLSDVTGECSAEALVPSAQDNCGGTIQGSTEDDLSYATQGTHVIHWSFDDGNGNISYANQNVIIDDITAPVAPTLSDVTGECSAEASVPSAQDNCGGTIQGSTEDDLSYSTQGTHVIHWSFDDGNGNISYANQNVIIDDITAPVAPVLSDVTGECSADASVPSAQDNCGGTIQGSTEDDLSYSTQGTHVIHWSFDDGNGNISYANQNVIIDDITAPVAPTLFDVTGECSAEASVPSAQDNCGGTIQGSTEDDLSYATQGTHVIHWSFDDGNGNISYANQNVIIDDITAPVAPTLFDVTGECSAEASVPSAQDNCGGTIQGSTEDDLSYATQGTHVIHWSFDDGNGNISYANQNVIIDDITAPVAPTLSDVTGECSAEASVPSAQDNCGGTIQGSTEDDLSYATQGTHVIHWSFDDGNGNISYANQNVIIDDITAPVAPTLSDVTGECSAEASVPSAQDNCGGTIQGATEDDLSYSTQGTHVIHWAFDDGNGNISYANQNVIIDDITAPSINCPANIVLSACQETASWSEPVPTDNCSGAVVTQVTGPASGSEFANGTTSTIEYKVRDAGGNEHNCSFTVTRQSELTASCSNTNNILYYGFTGDQTSTILVLPTGGVAPYRVSLSMNRPLKCNIINSNGDELWNPGANTNSSTGISCPASGSPSINPTSTSNNTVISSVGYSLTVSLMEDAVITATITDANGCTTTCSTTIFAEDVRCFAGNSGVPKVKLCHKTGSVKNPCVNICVDQSAVAEHLAHGDFFGNCTSNCQAPATNTKPDEVFEVKAYPNPSNSYFTFEIESESKESISIEVFDIAGRLIRKIDNSTEKTIVTGDDLPRGLYLAVVNQGTKQKTIRVVKE